jgi:carboxyl-terminal processing protease
MTLFKKLLIVLTISTPLTSMALVTDKLVQLEPMKEHRKTTAEIVSRLKQYHYQRTQVFLNDELSSAVLDRYLEELDRERSYFIASDIAEFEKYRYLLDDAFKTTNLFPAFQIFNRYQQRISERVNYLLSELDKGIDKLNFSLNEQLSTDRTKSAWLKSHKELDSLWHKRLKNDVLNLKLSGKKAEKITQLLEKRYKNQLKRIDQSISEDAYRVYMNALTLSYDPHTQYFPPRATKNFKIRMSLSLQGIGAMLQLEDEYTKVSRVITAGPADKAGQLKANDRIVGVGQGKKGEIIDVIGWRLDNVVDLIRGPKNTTVQLEILPGSAADSQQTKTISIVRDTVKLEEQAASKKVIDLSSHGKDHKLGIIEIPKFYIDFDAASRGDPNYKSTTRDVRKLIKELVKDNVEGIVIDLRNNGGGSLQEVDELVGLFIKKGPTVQVKGTTGRISVHKDSDNKTTYDGPIAVLVNRLSASASEIFAGAIQDYHRGIIVGTQTYGKGTVQAMMPLKHGQITLTQQKFYRISGNSTQNRGVIPDISLPSLYDVSEIGESALDGALPWDTIKATSYRAFPDFSSLVPHLQVMHEKRSSKDPDFNFLIKTNKLIEERRLIKHISLNEKTRSDDKDTLKGKQFNLENERRLAKGEALLKSVDELEKNKDDNEKDMKKEKDEKPKPLLMEAAYILIDFMNIQHPTLVKK